MAAKNDDARPENPFVKGSVYRVTSLGTQQAPTTSEGEFLGFTQVGMGAEGLMLELGSSHGDDAGKKRVIPLHMLLHVDVLEQAKDEETPEEDAGHVYYS